MVKKNLLVVANMALLTTGTINFDVNLSFTPTKCVMKRICYLNDRTETTVNQLYISLGTTFLGSFIDGTNESTDVEIDVSGFNNGQHTLSIYKDDMHTLTSSVSTAGILSVLFEFSN